MSVILSACRYTKEHKMIKRKCCFCGKRTHDVIRGFIIDPSYGCAVGHRYWCSEACAKEDRALRQKELDDYINLNKRIKGDT